MADAKISALPASTTPLAGTEVLPVVQSGVTKKVAVSDLTAGRSVATGVVTATNAAASQGVFTGWSPTGGANVANGSLDLGTAAGNKGIVSYDSTGAFPGALYVENTYNDGGASIRLRTRTVDRLIVEGNGDVKIATGNLVIGTSGKGIDFSADANAAGMTSELLDDYEEGTWTPVVTGTTTNPTIDYTTQEGVYTRVGRLVIATAFISINTASGGSGSCWISLPFAAAASATYTGSGSVSFATSWGTAAPSSARIIGGQSVGLMYYLNGTSFSQSAVTSFGTGANLAVTFMYEAA